MAKREIWRAISSLNGFYEASSLGRIRRAKPGHTTWVGRIIKIGYDGKGYGVVGVRDRTGGECIKRFVHQLVLEVFRGPCPKGKEPHHKDFTPRNNKISNLVYTTRKQNMRYSRQAGRVGKLSATEVRTIRRLYARGDIIQHKLASMFSVTQSEISDVILRIVWKDVKD